MSKCNLVISFKSFKAFAIPVLASLFLGACNYNIDKVTGGIPDGFASSPGTSSELSFENVYAVAIGPNCVSCHSAPRNSGGVNLQTYESVFENRRAVNWAVSSRFMPDSVGRSMPDQSRNLLLEWLAAGAPK